MTPGYELFVTQVRVLQALSDGGALSRRKLGEALCLAPGSGTIGKALRGVFPASGTAKPGLLEQGLIDKHTLREELPSGQTLSEECYMITPAGRQALKSWLAEHGVLPPLRDAKKSTNKNRGYRMSTRDDESEGS